MNVDKQSIDCQVSAALYAYKCLLYQTDQLVLSTVFCFQLECKRRKEW